MSQYLVVLGTTPELSLLELNSTLDQELDLWGERLVLVELENDEQAQELMLILGGAVKIVKIIDQLPEDEAQGLEQMAQYLSEQSERPTFSLSAANLGTTSYHSSNLKKVLRRMGTPSRFRKSDNYGLSAAVLIHETDVFDLIVVEHQAKYYLTQTVAIQNIDDWTKRDRSKPYADRRKGMLPPKIGRIMVNIGLGKIKAQEPVLYDPFCGTGTILIEGLLRSAQVVGSDIDHDSVAGTLENLYWLEQEYDQQFSYQVFQSDVAQAADRDWAEKVDLIVTEPFLGKLTPKPAELAGVFKGLYRLYLGAFKTWTEILKDQAVVVIVFPLAEAGNQRFELSKLIDKLEQYGYTLEVDPVHYAREHAVTQRQIYVFRYQSQI